MKDITFQIPFARTWVMGVINTTPDSFSDGGVHFDGQTAVASALAMLKAGADIIDVGGESTRPGSDFIEIAEELRRVIPVIEGIIEAEPDAVVSIDTRRSEVAWAAIEAGACIVNDITGFRDDPDIIDMVSATGAGAIIMHMLGMPKTMQTEIVYERFPEDIYDFLADRVAALENRGVARNKIVVDPGIGFGKTFDHNLILLNRLNYFLSLNKPILIGPSRKAFLGKITNEPVAANRDTATLGAIAAAVLKGASIVRVHNVPGTVTVCRVLDAIKRESVE
jgi:dihydropteroate synthase